MKVLLAISLLIGAQTGLADNVNNGGRGIHCPTIASDEVELVDLWEGRTDLHPSTLGPPRT